MRLKSLTLSGFKSFPDRTHLEFGPGVSVVVGPNGSGKSNVTDAVLWGMGEQSPLAVRGQSMQDVIFGGGRGVQARSAAEVEIVLDNSDGALDLPLSEISVVRRLDRAGEGGYRLNGARCRLVDVLEMLSDTGLGKEMHSVVSQGRVEAIVNSKPRDRRLLIEEAAGLGKHRKRRRRAQLKLERTQENVDRALDVEREARTRLRPLKRQAEAAKLHERLERQMLQARLELARDSSRARRLELTGAEERVKAARAGLEEFEARLQTVVDRRGRAERALTERAERHDALARRLYDARSARERVLLRGEQVSTSAGVLARRIERVESELKALGKAAREVAGETTHQTTSESAGPRSETSEPAPVGERFWTQAWQDVRKLILEGVERVLAQPDERRRAIAAGEVADEAERAARAAVERALAQGPSRGEALGAAHVAERPAGDPPDRPLRIERSRLIERLRAQAALDAAVAPLAARLASAIEGAAGSVDARVVQFEHELGQDTGAGEEVARELRVCAGEEAEIHTRLRASGDLVTEAEVAAQRLRDQAADAEQELAALVERLALDPAELAGRDDGQDGSRPAGPTAEQGALTHEQVQALHARLERLARRGEQLGPVNPLAQRQYAEALAHVEEMEGRRADLETALRELRALIRDTDRQIQETFQETFEATARNFEELVGDVFPGGSGRLRVVRDEQAPRAVLGGQSLSNGRSPSGSSELGGTGVAGAGQDADADAVEEAAEAQDALAQSAQEELLGVEIEITPAGKSMKRLSLMSGGEKSMTALAFLFAVFLARPCPFYVLDEVEAALDDLNLERFLALLRRYSDRAQFIVITHQKRTMEAADWLYGVSMGGDGVSKVLSRSLPTEQAQRPEVAEVA
jgi:chromosome segregation protein